MIYLIVCKTNNTCKVGYSINPYKRLEGLQTANPYKLELLYVIEGNSDIENQLHIKFKNYRLQGEWFKYNIDIKTYFQQHNILEEEPVKIYPELWNVILKAGMSASDIELFAYIVSNYAEGTVFSIGKGIKQEICKITGKSESSYNKSTKVLLDNKLIYRSNGDRSYKINPRYAFKGSSKNRNKELRLLLELTCKDC